MTVLEELATAQSAAYEKLVGKLVTSQFSSLGKDAAQAKAELAVSAVYAQLDRKNDQTLRRDAAYFYAREEFNAFLTTSRALNAGISTEVPVVLTPAATPPITTPPITTQPSDTQPATTPPVAPAGSLLSRLGVISSARAEEVLPPAVVTPAPDASPAAVPAPVASPVRPADFDSKNQNQVRALQEKLNVRFGDTRPPLELTGVMDDATKAAWKQFKSDDFTDGKISFGYVKDSISKEDFARLNLTDPRKFNRDQPPEEVVKAINQHLGLPEGTAYNSPEFQNAVMADKREKWIDDSVNAGAMAILDRKVADIKKAKEAAVSAPTPSEPASTLPTPNPSEPTPTTSAPTSAAPTPSEPTAAARTPAALPPAEPALAVPAPAPVAPTPAEPAPTTPAPAPVAPTPAEPAATTPAPAPVAPTPAEPAPTTPAPAPVAPAPDKHQLTKPHASAKVAAWQHAMNEYDKKHGGQHQIAEDGLWGKKETQALFESLGGKGKEGVKNVINKMRRDGITIDPSKFEVVAPPEAPHAPEGAGNQQRPPRRQP